MEFYKLNDGSVVASFTGSIEEAEILKPNSVDASKEKHLPKVEINGDNVTVKVGEVEHPMTEEHYINFIAVETKKKKVLFKEFNPGNKPIAKFVVANNDEVEAVYEYCSLHGLWKI